jgi:hypothetical protein
LAASLAFQGMKNYPRFPMWRLEDFFSFRSATRAALRKKEGG